MSSAYCDCKRPSCTKCSTNPECNIVRCASREPYDSLKTDGIEHSCCGKGYCGVAGSVSNPENRTTIPEKLIFIAEWYEKDSDLIKKYLFIYYMLDGTAEIKDLINDQRFLRRLKLDTVTLPRLYLGNVINIYGRQITLAEYADSCTEQYLEPRRQRARMATMSIEMVERIYGHHRAESFYLGLIKEMTSGPVVAFLLIGENAIERLLCLGGDMDPGTAKLKKPDSLRALYGKDLVQNAIHISESSACVDKDSSMFFTNCRSLLPALAPGTALFKCSTLCLIKPHAFKYAGRIIEQITRAGFNISAFEKFYLDRTHGEEFYEIYKGVLPEYSEMTAELALGPCYALEISGCGEETPTKFREFAGPFDPIIARKLRPTSLRGKYGTSKVLNAVHCTDLCEDAEAEVDYFFRILQMI